MCRYRERVRELTELFALHDGHGRVRELTELFALHDGVDIPAGA